MTEPDFLHTTRAFYDAIATDYDAHFGEHLAARPMDRAVLAGFAELVRAADAGPVADLGCGPGRVTAHLAGLGLPVFGVDLSPQMVALARRTHPQVRFEVGAMTGLELPDGALGAIVAWYSIIHTPQERLPELFAAFHRLLAPGGTLLLAFQVGDEPLHVAQPFGHPVALDFRRRRPDRIAGLLTAAGLEVRTRMLREPDEELGESTPQGFLLARKPAGA
ncbi:class I SAM-dependent methyltransferase [Streptomyces sp. RPA4-5]|uniref:class I SAM-dependent DNA methyltransferase n=1 Tax=unclassified Streptomyces TaxID=2593676 RepID=UPI00143E51F5|nr:MULTISPECIES: class I SAM-dependent methyltransferase [unclassified Streptomyces]QIY55783.1 class I SAM-dependent methyltransferase [Streptomyces sp. RPA4-5]WJY38576.1 class I SAM-dependent methyltransferase [Streptomyces sp. P9-2B-2]